MINDGFSNWCHHYGYHPAWMRRFGVSECMCIGFALVCPSFWSYVVTKVLMATRWGANERWKSWIQAFRITLNWLCQLMHSSFLPFLLACSCTSTLRARWGSSMYDTQFLLLAMSLRIIHYTIYSEVLKLHLVPLSYIKGTLNKHTHMWHRWLEYKVCIHNQGHSRCAYKT